MVFCVAGLFVFGILGIFSAKYREYFKESFRCVFRMVRLKPCDTDFDQKMKAKITARFMKISPTIAKFNYKYFDKISVVFVALMIISFAFFFSGIYNYIVYGNCNGPSSEGYCIYDAIEIGEKGCECDPEFSSCILEEDH